MEPGNSLIRCQCGKVECRGQGAPVITAVCYCDDCQAAAREIEARGGPPVADPDGGTALALIRTDRFTHTAGKDLLDSHRLRADSPTVREVASCCNSAMYLRFEDGRFWYSVMRNRFVGTQPAIGARLATKFRDSPLPWPDEAPRYSGFPARFILRMVGEWFLMKLGR